MKKRQTNQKLKVARLLAWLVSFVLLILMGGSFVWAQSLSGDEATNPGQEIRAQKKEMINSQKEAVLEKRAEVKEKIEEKKAQLQERACERIENRIRTRINRYENNQQKDRNVFEGMIERLERLITVFETKGLDTADLEDDLTTLKEKVANLNQAHQDFIDSLKETQQYACGQSDGQFRNKLGESRRVIAEVKEAIRDIRQFYAGTVRVHLLQIRNQWQEQVMNQQEEQEEQGDESVVNGNSEEDAEDENQQETETTTMENVQ